MKRASWKKWHDGAAARVRALLGARTASDLEALRESCKSASTDDLVKTRELVKRVARALDAGDAALWRRLALALDVIDLGTPPQDDEPGPEGSADSTLRTAAAPEPGSRRSVDDTLAEIRIELANESSTRRGVTSRPAGSTLPEGRKPPAEAPSSVLDIERYAVLCAWTEAHPQRRDQLHAQYGLDGEDERRKLDEDFESLFQRDERLRGAFEKRLRLHLGYLKGP